MGTRLSNTQFRISNSQILAQWGMIPAAVAVQDSSQIHQGPKFCCCKPEEEKGWKRETSPVWPPNPWCLKEMNLQKDNVCFTADSLWVGVPCGQLCLCSVLHLKSGHLLCPLGSTTSLLPGIAQGPLPQLREPGSWNRCFINDSTADTLGSEFTREGDFFVSSTFSPRHLKTI